MRRVLAVATLFVAFASTSQAAPVPGQKTALAQLPANSTVVVQLRGIDGTIDRIVAFLKNAVPDHAATAEAALRGLTQQALEGRSLDAVSKKGPIFVTFLGTPETEAQLPNMAIVLKVSSYEKFRDGLLKEDERKSLKKGDGFESAVTENGSPLFFADKKEFAVISPREDIIKQFVKKGKDISTKMTAKQAETLLDCDLGVFLQMDVFAKDYAAQIKLAKDSVKEGLEAARQGLDKNTQAQIDIAAKLIEPTFQAVEDSRGLAASISFEPTNLVVHFESEMRDGSTTAKLLKKFGSDEFGKLGELPNGLMFYTAMKLSPTLLEMLNEMAGSTAQPDSDEAKAAAAALEALSKAGPGTRVDGAGIPLRAIQITQFENAEKALQASLESLTALGAGAGYSQGVVKGKPKVTKNAQKHKGITFHYVTAEWDWDKILSGFDANPGLPEGAKKQFQTGMEKMLGKNLSLYIGTDGKNVVQVTAPNWATAKKLLDEQGGDSTVAKNKDFEAMRKQLAKETTFLGIVDLPQYMVMIVDFVKPMLQDQIPLPPGFPAKLKQHGTSFMGVTATMKDNRAELELVVSAKAILDCYRAFVSPFIPGDL